MHSRRWLDATGILLILSGCTLVMLAGRAAGTSDGEPSPPARWLPVHAQAEVLLVAVPIEPAGTHVWDDMGARMRRSPGRSLERARTGTDARTWDTVGDRMSPDARKERTERGRGGGGSTSGTGELSAPPSGLEENPPKLQVAARREEPKAGEASVKMALPAQGEAPLQEEERESGNPGRAGDATLEAREGTTQGRPSHGTWMRVPQDLVEGWTGEGEKGEGKLLMAAGQGTAPAWLVAGNEVHGGEGRAAREEKVNALQTLERWSGEGDRQQAWSVLLHGEGVSAAETEEGMWGARPRDGEGWLLAGHRGPYVGVRGRDGQAKPVAGVTQAVSRKTRMSIEVAPEGVGVQLQVSF